MTGTVATTIVLSFSLGWLTYLGNETARLFLNKQSAVGCLLYCVSFLTFLVASLIIISLVSNLFGLPRVDLRVLGSYAVGYSLPTVVKRYRASRGR
jgi:hypothetical protein